MEIDRKQIMESFLRIIDHFSDKNYQMRVWIRIEGPECQAYDDAACDFFDIGDTVLNNYKEFSITEVQNNILKKFRDQFQEFSDKHDDWPAEFIDTPEWQKIMDMAKSVLKAFNYPNVK